MQSSLVLFSNKGELPIDVIVYPRTKKPHPTRDTASKESYIFNLFSILSLTVADRGTILHLKGSGYLWSIVNNAGKVVRNY